MLDIGNSSRHRKSCKLIEHCPLSYKREMDEKNFVIYSAIHSLLPFHTKKCVI